MSNLCNVGMVLSLNYSFNIFLFFSLDLLICVVCLYVHHMGVWCSQRSDEGVRFPGTGETGGCKPPHGCWELNPGPLQ
jgi:hypothetical protein